MKNYLIIFILLAFSACENKKIDPDVETLRIEAIDSLAAREANMATELYQYYLASDKSKNYYEVISKNRGQILNYNTKDQLITVCTDPGSGWGGQFKNIDIATLKRISDNKIIFSMYYDSLIVNSNSEYIEPKTNGNP